jgi:hypothetical protein
VLTTRAKNQSRSSIYLNGPLLTKDISIQYNTAQPPIATLQLSTITPPQNNNHTRHSFSPLSLTAHPKLIARNTHSPRVETPP